MCSFFIFYGMKKKKKWKSGFRFIFYEDSNPRNDGKTKMILAPIKVQKVQKCIPFSLVIYRERFYWTPCHFNGRGVIPSAVYEGTAGSKYYRKYRLLAEQLCQ